MCQNLQTAYINESTIRRNKTRTQGVPCGKCALCIKSSRLDWTFRIEKHMEVVYPHYFVTLTYNNENLPYYYEPEYVDYSTGEIVPPKKTDIWTLKPQDLTNFFKRLRYYYDEAQKTLPDNRRKKISYFAVGEYGTLHGRPHYHILLFNMDLPYLIDKSWRVDGVPIGFTQCDNLRDGGIPYVLKYLDKQRYSRSGLLRQREFKVNSKGLGINYLTPAVIDQHRYDLERTFILLKGGAKMRIPRYYKNKIYFDVSCPLQSICKRFPANAVTMQQVREYLQARADKAFEEKLADYMRHHPRVSEENARRNLHLSKLNVNFQPRRNEVF